MTDNDINEFVDKFRSNAKVIHNKADWDGFDANISTFTDLLWPCKMYHVEVQIDDNELDIFERTILRLAECKITRTEDVAKTTCLARETVEFIQNRLASRNFLNERIFTITEDGQQVINDLKEGKNDKTEVVCVFKDLICGKILAYVKESPALNPIDGAFPSKNRETDEIDRNDFMFRYSVPGNEEKKAHIVFPDDFSAFSNYEESKPKTFQILRAIRTFNKIAKKNKILIGKNSAGVEIKSPELVLLHSLAFATNGEAKLFCTDGAGLGISDDFTEYIRNNSDKLPWMKKLFSKGEGETNAVENEEENDENKMPNFAHRNISKLIYYYAKDIKELEAEGKTENNSQREEKKRVAEKIVYNIYTAFELALQMYHKEYHNETSEDKQMQLANAEARKLNKEKISETTTIDDAMLLFYPLAENLEFNLTELEKGLLKTYKGKINGMRNEGEAELLPLLCLALAEAQDDENCSMRSLAKKNPDLILQLYKLKGLRDKTIMAHGPGIPANESEPKKIKRLCENIIQAMEILNRALVDDFTKIKDAEFITKIEYTSAEQKRYNTKVKLYEEFGISRLNRLNSSLAEQLVNCELTFNERKYVVTSACSLVQQFMEAAVSSLLKTRNAPAKELRNTNEVERKYKTAEFALCNGSLPDSIRTVNYKRINKAVCGGGCDSLGAAIVAFILLCSKEELGDIAMRNKNIILDLAEMLNQRGHADIKDYSLQEVSTLRRKSYMIIKELIEFID